MENKIFTVVDKILWTDWDPIDVKDLPMCRDEYRSYVTAIYSLKIAGSDRETIAVKLFEIARKEMGIILTMEVCRKVTGKIINI